MPRIMKREAAYQYCQKLDIPTFYCDRYRNEITKSISALKKQYMEFINRYVVAKKLMIREPKFKLNDINKINSIQYGLDLDMVDATLLYHAALEEADYFITSDGHITRKEVANKIKSRLGITPIRPDKMLKKIK